MTWKCTSPGNMAGQHWQMFGDIILFCAILKASQFNQRERTRCCRCTELLNMTQRTSESVLSQTHGEIQSSLRAGTRTEKVFQTTNRWEARIFFSTQTRNLVFQRDWAAATGLSSLYSGNLHAWITRWLPPFTFTSDQSPSVGPFSDLPSPSWVPMEQLCFDFSK